MAIIKCPLIVFLFVISLSFSLQDNTAVNIKVKENPYQLPKHVVPSHYDIKLMQQTNHDGETSIFGGEANIDFEVFKPTYTITLHISEPIIHESMTKLKLYKGKVGNALVCCEPDLFPVERYEHNSDAQTVTIHFRRRLVANRVFVLKLMFTSFIGEDMSGIYRTFYTDNEGNQIWLTATYFYPVYARKAFPCWDEPAMKATFKFSIDHLSNYTALSSMRVSKRLKGKDGRVWTHFETTPIMSTNILGFVIVDYNYDTIQDGTMLLWGPKQIKHGSFSLTIAVQVTSELERFTNSTIHVPEMNHVVVPRYPVYGFESWGMITYTENVLIQNKSLIDKLDNMITIAHELSHQWFGNLVSPAWWDYLWLSEGMSTYLSYYILDKIGYVRFHYHEQLYLTDLFAARNVLSMLFLDSHCLTSLKDICTPININIGSHNDISNAYSKDTYTKSGALLRMVSHFVREDVFQNGLLKYLQKHKYKSVTPDDLWEALQDALDESDVPHDNFKVKEVMDTWFNQPAYPVVRIDRNRGNGMITVTQHKRFHFRKIIETEGNHSWWIPLNYITKSNLNASSTLATHWLTPYNKSIIIQGEKDNINNMADWIIVNKQSTGYYRVNYDITNWQRIAAFLNSDNYDKIPVLNRAQIIDDVYYMMETEDLDFRTLISVIKYLWRETNLIAWYPALRVIQSIAISYMRIPEGATIFQPFFLNLTNKLFEDIGFEEKDNETAVTVEIRSEFTKFACLYNIYYQCRESTTAKLLAYVDKPTVFKLSSDQEYLFCFGLLEANDILWHQFLDIRSNTSTDIKFLSCSENLNIIENHFIDLRKLKKYSYTSLFLSMFENLPINVDVVYLIIIYYKEVAAELDSMPHFATTLHNELLNYFRDEDIKVIKCLLKNRTLFLKDEYLDDRIKKINKIHQDLSNIRSILKDN